MFKQVTEGSLVEINFAKKIHQPKRIPTIKWYNFSNRSGTAVHSSVTAIQFFQNNLELTPLIFMGF